MKTSLPSTLLIATGLLIGVHSSPAQPFSMVGSTAGGAASSGGSFVLNGAAGQAESGPGSLNGGPFSLAGGFWSIETVPTADSPRLSIERQNGGVRLFWPGPATGFVLDQSLTATGAWSQVSFPYTTNGNTIGIQISAPTGRKFYRLRKP